MTATLTSAAPCAACGAPLTVSGEPIDPEPFLGEPQHVFCDLCGKAEHPANMPLGWNDETGCHMSCESKVAEMAQDHGELTGVCLRNPCPDPDHAMPARRSPAELTLANGGGTFRADTLEPVNPDSGYAVALDGDTYYVDGASVATIEDAITRTRDGHPFEPRAYDAPYIGTWIHDDTLYVDYVLILPDLQSALIVARTFGQKAIYSFELGEEIVADGAA